MVAKMRGILSTRTVGHTGTLDPMATGVLPVMVGRATRAAVFLEDDSKEYVARFRTGIVTDTQDITGRVLREGEPCLDPDAVRKAAESFTGKGVQVPPMYSAVKINGKKLYELARRGVEIDRPPRNVEFYSIEVPNGIDGEYELRVRCSKGAYIRTLCHDIGEKLGCGAAMSSLRRTAAGRFDIGMSRTLGELEELKREGLLGTALIPTDKIFSAFPGTEVSAAEEKRCRTGTPYETGLPEGRYRVYSAQGEFLMLGQVTGSRMETVRSFFEV